MHNRSKLLIVALIAAFLLALGAGAATASRSLVTTGGGQNITGTQGALVFVGSNGVRMTCEVTLSGSIHAAIAKAARALMGHLFAAPTRNCRNTFGITPTSATALIESRRPWHIEYVGILGTLPAITGVLGLIKGTRFLLRFNEMSCLYEGDVPAATGGTGGAREYTIRTMAATRNTVRLVRAEGEEFFRTCPPTGEMGAQAFAITPNVTLTLG